MSIPGHAIANAYDKAGRLLSTTAGGRTLSYLYDAASNRTRVTHPDGVYFTYDYDALGRVSLIRENGAVTLASYGYDDLSRRTLVTLGNGTTTSYGYEADGALDALTNNMAGTAQDVTFGFDYNRVNQIAFKTASTPLYDWTALYDKTVASSHNGLNQLTAVQTGGLAAAIAHDANGNLTGDGVWAYTYDAGNRLRTAAKPGVSASYSYDGLGRRVSKTGTGVAATWYLTDGDAMVAEYAASTGTAPLRRYVHGPGVDEPIVVYDGAGTASKRWFYRNWQGSIIAEANASGSVTSTYRYGPYGEPDALTGAMFRYTGQLLDAETGLYYYKARYYSPQLGRFLQTDPIGYQDDQNLYAYVGGDPVNGIDPSGEATECVETQSGMQCRETGDAEEIVVTGQKPSTRTNVGVGIILFGAGITQVDSPAPGPADLVGFGIVGLGVLIGGEGAFDLAKGRIFANEEKSYGGETPDDKPGDFEPLGPSRGHKATPQRKKSDGSVWEKDRDGHGGSKWKRWPNQKAWNSNKGRESVRPDGTAVKGPGDGK